MTHPEIDLAFLNSILNDYLYISHVRKSDPVLNEMTEDEFILIVKGILENVNCVASLTANDLVKQQ